MPSSNTAKPVAGAGPLSDEQRTGFFPHVPLAVTPERLPLGVIDAMTWGRDPEDDQKNDPRQTKPIEEQESSRWLWGDRQACAVAAAVPGTPILSISDREGDIYECFVEAQTIEGRRETRAEPGSPVGLRDVRWSVGWAERPTGSALWWASRRSAAFGTTLQGAFGVVGRRRLARPSGPEPGVGPGIDSAGSTVQPDLRPALVANPRDDQADRR
jgi:hypothetical protein